MTKITNPIAIIVVTKNIWILWEIAKCDTLMWTEQMLLKEQCRWTCCCKIQQTFNLETMQYHQCAKKNKEERKQKHTCRGIPVDRMDKYILFMSIKFKRFSIVAPSNTFKCTHCLKYFMFNYLAMMPNCSEGNLYKSQERQLIKLADQDIEDNHPHLVTTHLIQIKLVF